MGNASLKIFTAKRIITMNPALPFATAIAVQGERIVGVGTIEDLAQWGDHEIHDEFKDHVGKMKERTLQ